MVLAGWFRAFVAIAHGGRDYLARKGAQPRSWIAIPARLARLGLRPQGMDRTRRCRNRRGPQVQPRRSLFKHRPIAGPWTLQRIGAEGPRAIRSRPRRSAQSRNAGRMTATRRLAAILAADVAGYSRLIGADESGTLQALKAIRGELIDPKIAEHRGRLVKTTGDGLLVEFGSVVDALRCATEVQAGMAQRNATVPADKRIEFRVGINMGD